MSEGLLVVPIRVDALHLAEAQAVVEPFAMFDKLPYVDSSDDVPRDVNSDIAYISENLISPPFNDHNHWLQPGIHLHWALPDALSHARTAAPAKATDTAKTEYHSAPNRWLVVRTDKGSGEERKWLVESDYLWSSAPADDYEFSYPISYPLIYPPKGRAPFRYMGRVLELNEHGEHSDAGKGKYLCELPTEKLTAFGYGEPTFAAVYPNCQSVFGFWDKGITNKSKTNKISYEVFGWYSQEADDPVLQLTKAANISGQTLKGQLSWNLQEQKELAHNSKLLCYGKVTFSEDVPEEKPLPASIKTAVGNTSTEALSAYLANEIFPESPDKKRDFEHQLESLHLTADLQHHRLDLGPKFHEARHNQSFAPHDGGTLWTIRKPVKKSRANPSDSISAEAPALSSKAIRLLHELNEQQAAWNNISQAIKSLRQEIFSEWYKYMLCSYHPADQARDYPPIDLVKRHIETLLGDLEGAEKTNRDHVIAIEDKKSAINACLKKLADGDKQSSKLLEIPAPRYWQPNEPVLLMAGDALKTSDRHGADGLLCCKIVEVSLDPNYGPDPSLLKKNEEFECCNRLTAGSPWHPLLLEWETAIHPVHNKGNMPAEKRTYEPEFITENYTLEETKTEILRSKKEAKTGVSRSVIVGRSIVTPHASLKLKAEIDAYKDSLGAGKDESQAQNGFFENINKAKEQLDKNHVQAQALSGFNAALLMHRQTLQLPIADPLAFKEYQGFAAKVKEGVRDQNLFAPEPQCDFHPIRSGEMEINRLRLVDSFGRVHPVSIESTVTTSQMDSNKGKVSLPPRITQPARINFRWLSAQDDKSESGTDPDSSPVCGWLLPNNLGGSLMIYASDGSALGSVGKKGDWQTPPGRTGALSVEEIKNKYLQQTVKWVCRKAKGTDFLSKFIDILDSALENIDPENYMHHQARALLMGRPIALIRAMVNIELLGAPQSHQGWEELINRFNNSPLETNNFTKVKYPIRIGEHQQLNDGVVGYWLDDNEKSRAEVFHAPQSRYSENLEQVKALEIYHDGSPPQNFEQALDDAPQHLLMLMDPRGQAHCTTGILPTKAIDIPQEHFADALAAINVTFLTAPILTQAGQINLPLPAEPGFHWSWLHQDTDKWTEISSQPTVEFLDFSKAFEDDKAVEIWDALIKEKWIKPIESKLYDKAVILSVSHNDLAGFSPKELSKVRELLSRIGAVHTEFRHASTHEIREGWLQLVPIDRKK